MANNLRFILNLQKIALCRHNAATVSKLTTTTINRIRVVQKRFETNQATTPPVKNSSSPVKRFSKYFLIFFGGVFGYYGISMYLDFFEDKADTSPSALKYKPGIIKETSKKVSFLLEIC